MQNRKTLTPLRGYQQRAVAAALVRSTIAVLPTGSGKTLIAAAVIAHQKAPARVLFVVPTVVLVAQQATVLRKETKLVVAELSGGIASNAAVDSNFNVIVATPAAALNAAEKSPDLEFSRFQLIVFDEIHHVIKKHPYRSIALLLTSMNPTCRPRILGLTSSLTYSVGKDKIQNSIEQLCADLLLEKESIFTVSSDELVNDGYHAAASKTKTAVNLCEKIELEEDYNSFRALKLPGQAHEDLAVFLRHVAGNINPIHPLSIALMLCIRFLEKQVHLEYPQFSSPIDATGKLGRVAEWGKLAHNLASLPKLSPTLKLRLNILEHLYEGTRLIVNSKQSALELAMHYIQNQGIFSDEYISKERCLLPLSQLWSKNRSDFRRLPHLKSVLLDQCKRVGIENFRCIVFTQQRLTTHVLDEFVKLDIDLSRLRSSCIYSAKTSASASYSVNQTQVKERIAQFAAGYLQILFATSVAEEGIDIPAANCVIRFDHIQTPVSLVQSRGRARQYDSTFIVMQESSKRSVRVLESSEQEQVAAIHEINANGFKLSTKQIRIQRMNAQEQRRRGARKILERYEQTHTWALKAYAQKISGEVTESVSEKQLLYVATLKLSQFGEAALHGSGQARSKKDAINEAALHIIEQVKLKY
ncbi:Interferon-induced helicase C domain-containing protein 1 [Physocladia obscura]|uniref:Interferon-induced helicase C domain-containing protein 1 n=1 Tax=Physocladia obscura TaxID=109957 RepID=A0AAD5SXI6_9FUNG|nr:Interferon-induced helicase C domain-containing protein 1 [Physocladia obscura]